MIGWLRNLFRPSADQLHDRLRNAELAVADAEEDLRRWAWHYKPSVQHRMGQRLIKAKAKLERVRVEVAAHKLVD